MNYFIQIFIGCLQKPGTLLGAWDTIVAKTDKGTTISRSYHSGMNIFISFDFVGRAESLQILQEYAI